jgi:hypothetical protein
MRRAGEQRSTGPQGAAGCCAPSADQLGALGGASDANAVLASVHGRFDASAVLRNSLGGFAITGWNTRLLLRARRGLVAPTLLTRTTPMNVLRVISGAQLQRCSRRARSEAAP